MGELGRWNPFSLALLAPAWSYHLAGPADHWWFVARSEDRMYFYVAQFCSDNGKNHVTGCVLSGLCAAVAYGLQYTDAKWWYARDWKPTERARSKADLDRLVITNPAVAFPYSWVHNNCQHFACLLYEGDEMSAA